MDRFVGLCKARVDRFARVQTDQSIRLSCWMDWDRSDADWRSQPARKSYFTMSEENNYTITRAFSKKCHDRKLVYRGYDAMPWCPRHASGLSEMEVKEGYKLVEHRAVFVEFPLREAARRKPARLDDDAVDAHQQRRRRRQSRSHLSPSEVQGRGVFHVASAFKADRLERRGGGDDDEGGETKACAARPVAARRTAPEDARTAVQGEGTQGFEIVGEVKGSELVGLAYDGPFDDLPAVDHACGYPDVLARRPHGPGRPTCRRARCIASSPGRTSARPRAPASSTSRRAAARKTSCSARSRGYRRWRPLDESGTFLPGGDLTGRSAVDPALPEMVCQDLTRKHRLFATERYVHRYPHCWRCKTELLFRLVDEWFIAMSWRDEIIAVSDQVTYLPESINGRAKERNWLENMGDWMISKKRFWGLALPIWVDEVTGEFEVIGSREELRERAVEGWEQFEGHTAHRPWIDLVKIRNPRTGNRMSRIADVGNPWLDAGIVPYSTMGYRADRAEWERWFPADFITESFPGQFRNWFYAILAMSTMMENRPPMKVLLGHALVRDEHGKEMHKSAGNAIAFEEAADRMGADLMRWMYCRHNPAANINFGYGPADELRARFTLKLWNTYAFFCNYARLDNFDPNSQPIPLADRPDLDRWILSDLQRLVNRAHDALRGYDVMAFCLEAERFVDDKLSNWYVRRSRRRFWKSEQGGDKASAYQTLYQVLVTLAKLFAPIMPFLAETLYQNLVVRGAGHGPESVHLSDYPQPDAGLIDDRLSEDMEALLRLVSLGSAARNAVKIKVRQPLAELRVQPAGDADRRAVERFGEQITEELNVKRVTLHDSSAGGLLLPEVRLNMKTLGPKLGPRLKEAQAAFAKASCADLAAKVQKGEPFLLGDLPLDPADLIVSHKAADGWAGVVDRGTQVAIDARITEALAREGMARDVIRQIQELRKQSGLEMEDRITLYLATESEPLRLAIDAHRDYIAGETLTTGWATTPFDGGGRSAKVKIEGKELTIALTKA
ncbi:MAG: class I tRNA ligase family protein [Gemmataceae bacterium]